MSREVERSVRQERPQFWRGPYHWPSNVAIFPVSGRSALKRGRFRALRLLGIFIVLLGALLMMEGLISGFATDNYLRGFAQAIVPASLSPEQRAERLLDWIRGATEPRSLDGENPHDLDIRDPLDNLNNRKLLEVCGTSVNAYINLASAVGVKARRLILAGADYGAVHVVAELYLDGRWVVVDTTFRRLMRNPNGRLLTKEDLRDVHVLRAATAGIPKYLPIYTYERVTNVHLEKIPYLGKYMRTFLNRSFPRWENGVWPMVAFMDRRSSIRVLVGALEMFIGFLFIWILHSSRHVRLWQRSRKARRSEGNTFRTSGNLDTCSRRS